MRPFRKRTKRTMAVSTVIANMMMITITLGLAAILIAWTGSTYGIFTSGAQIFYSQRGQALQERFVAEEVYFNRNQHQLLVYVRNVGAEQINVTAIYLNGTAVQASSIVTTCGSISVGALIPVNSVCQFTLNYSSIFPSLQTGSIVYIIIASTRGNRATFTVRA